MSKKSGKASKQAAAKKPASKSKKILSVRKPRSVNQPAKLPSVWKLARATYLILWQNKGLLAGITLIYGLLVILLAQGFSGGRDLTEIKDSLNQVFAGNFQALGSGLSIFVFLVGSVGSASNPSAGTYQFILTILASLAIIWSLRQILAGSTIRVRDAYYQGMYPLVPFVLVLALVGLQLVPLLVGSSLYGAVTSGGIAVLLAERIFWILVYAGLAALSFYMLASSLIALYIATLPDMTPIKALRSARELVSHRRWKVMLRILALPIFLLAAAAIIMLPVIIFLTPLAQLIFFLLTLFSLAAVHAYMYTLYRELLNE